MPAIVQNLYFEQGADNSRTFTFVWQIELVCAIDGRTVPVTQIEIDPIPAIIPAGFELHFSCDQKLTVAAAVPAGSKNVSISSYSGRISAGATCKGVPADYSAGTYSCEVRDRDGGTVIASPVVVGSIGGVVVTLSDTPIVPWNIRRRNLPEGNPQTIVQSRELMGADYKKGYPYQIDNTLGLQKTRIFEGLVFIGGSVASA